MKCSLPILLFFTALVIPPHARAQGWPDSLTEDIQGAAIAIADNWVNDKAPQSEQWAWGEGVLNYGLVKVGHTLKRDDYIAWLDAYIRHHDQAQVEMLWSDHLSPGISALYLTRHVNPLRPVPDIAHSVIDYIMTAPRTERQRLLIHLGYRADLFPYSVPGYPDAWVDSLFHITANLVLYTQLSGDQTYLEEAVYQVKHFFLNLQDPDTGLMAHGYFDLSPKDYEVPRFEQDEFWARGNGWALTSIVDLLVAMDTAHPDYAGLLLRAQKLAQALSEAQGADGRFHTLLTKSSTYYETAGTALILYGLARGVNTGLFDERAREVVVTGSRSLLDNTLLWRSGNSLAEVRYTSIGTNPSPGWYRWVPRARQVNYGVGAWLMLAAELMQ